MANRGFFEECWVPYCVCGHPLGSPSCCPDEPGGAVNIDHHEPNEPYVLTRDIASVVEDRVDGAERHPLSQRFWEKLLGAGEMHDRKQADYGRDDDPFYNIKQSAGWGISPWVGAMMRADDKMGRLRVMAQSPETQLVNEPVEDSLMDIAVYALIALVLREEESARSAQGDQLSLAG